MGPAQSTGARHHLPSLQTWLSDAWETDSGLGTEAWLCSVDPCILTGKTLNKDESAL